MVIIGNVNVKLVTLTHTHTLARPLQRVAISSFATILVNSPKPLKAIYSIYLLNVWCVCVRVCMCVCVNTLPLFAVHSEVHCIALRPTGDGACILRISN